MVGDASGRVARRRSGSMRAPLVVGPLLVSTVGPVRVDIPRPTDYLLALVVMVLIFLVILIVVMAVLLARTNFDS